MSGSNLANKCTGLSKLGPSRPLQTDIRMFMPPGVVTGSPSLHVECVSWLQSFFS